MKPFTDPSFRNPETRSSIGEVIAEITSRGEQPKHKGYAKVEKASAPIPTKKSTLPSGKRYEKVEKVEESHSRAALEKLSITQLRELQKKYAAAVLKGDRKASEELATVRGLLRAKGAGSTVDEGVLDERIVGGEDLLQAAKNGLSGKGKTFAEACDQCMSGAVVASRESRECLYNWTRGEPHMKPFTDPFPFRTPENRTDIGDVIAQIVNGKSPVAEGTVHEMAQTAERSKQMNKKVDAAYIKKDRALEKAFAAGHGEGSKRIRKIDSDYLKLDNQNAREKSSKKLYGKGGKEIDPKRYKGKTVGAAGNLRKPKGNTETKLRDAYHAERLRGWGVY